MVSVSVFLFGIGYGPSAWKFRAEAFPAAPQHELLRHHDVHTRAAPDGERAGDPVSVRGRRAVHVSNLPRRQRSVCLVFCVLYIPGPQGGGLWTKIDAAFVNWPEAKSRSGEAHSPRRYDAQEMTCPLDPTGGTWASYRVSSMASKGGRASEGNGEIEGNFAANASRI